jgi:hypothetical protein
MHRGPNINAADHMLESGQARASCSPRKRAISRRKSTMGAAVFSANATK